MAFNQDPMRTITCDVLLVLQETKWQSGMSVLRVVSWNKGKPTLEKRSFRPDPERDGEWRTGKASGMNLEDLKIVMGMAEEILRIMEPKGNRKPTGPLQDEIPF